ncbi:DUF262 domain-containing HNH endonuclease family protein [Treponema bryantii]|uniref:DUF262 domain-containing protein n=1 Tax=Treponema bryantii TaxID=163 RepID=UPI002B2B2FA8|nr:hypothetical protein TRBR_16080 [Treponema bryantii]
MEIEPGRIINDFIEPNKKQYTIPVYQRNYEWSSEQCIKLFQDIVQAYKRDKTHFCGSVVYAYLKEEHNIVYYVLIDGQQRITTVYLLLKAMRDLAETAGTKELIDEALYNVDKFDTYDVTQQSKLKLKPVESDNNQLYLLMEEKYDKVDKSTGIWINYELFTKLIKEEQAKGLTVKEIYKGLEKLLCAKIKLGADDNAQEIFERINSTGVPLNLSDKIRNFVLMTDVNQEKLYKDYWLEIENLIDKKQMPNFFQDYLNLKIDGFAKESTAYEYFKKVFRDNNYTNESMLQELFHYAKIYHVFLYGDKNKYNEYTNKALDGLRNLKQTTVYLFLFSVFDDFENKVITEEELDKVLSFLLSYSIRRLICDVASNSLRGLYKTLYTRIFSNAANKENYYDSIVSFMLQLSTNDAIRNDTIFKQALIDNNLYRKNALCKYLLSSIENQGKESLEIETGNLTIEHILPQNKNLSEEWQKMLGSNWEFDKEKYQHTLGNLTLTGYNSELGDRPFTEKLELLDSKNTKVVVLYKDVNDCKEWNINTILNRANILADMILQLFPIENPKNKISFDSPGYKEYSCDNPDNAEYKRPDYYILQGEKVNCNSFASMLISLSKRLYDLDSTIIETLAKENVHLVEGKYASFSYDRNQVNEDTQIEGTEIYISHNYNSPKLIKIISQLLDYYEIEQSDFVYSACSTDIKK